MQMSQSHVFFHGLVLQDAMHPSFLRCIVVVVVVVRVLVLVLVEVVVVVKVVVAIVVVVDSVVTVVFVATNSISGLHYTGFWPVEI